MRDDSSATTDAGFFLRLWAALVDLSMVSLAVPLFSAISNRLGQNVVEYFAKESLFGEGITEDLVLACIAALGIAMSVSFIGWFLSSAFFLALCESLIGASPGKWLVGLRVVQSSTGRSPGIFRALLRQSAKFLSWVPAGTGFLMPLWTRRAQALHDKIARCFVVRDTERDWRRIGAAIFVSGVLLFIQYPTLERSVLELKTRAETIRYAYRVLSPTGEAAWEILKREMNLADTPDTTE